jgi:teichuronic acid biosynthesis glycosyltransferase TuaC
MLKKPSVIKLHGSDINVMSTLADVRPNLAWGLKNANRVVSVSRALAKKVVDLGADPDRVHVVRNGINQQQFYVRSRDQAREALGYSTKDRWLVFVGFMREAKGVLELVQAFSKIHQEFPDVKLVFVGDGDGREVCEKAAAGLGDRVMMVGTRPHDEVALWLSAADLFTLPSWNEGTPNVVLEALACGIRVVASDVGGIPDVLDRPELGEMVPAKNAEALAEALRRGLSQPYDRAEIAAMSGCISWEQSAQQLREVLQAAVLEGPR